MEKVCFENYRREINRILGRNNKIIKDLDDWWLFASKFESLRSKGNSNSNNSSKDKSALNQQLKKSVNLSKEEESFFKEFLKNRLYLPKSVLDLLETAILAYLQFKKKQEEEKLKKLRESKENLPVYQFKDEIINAVKHERVIIIAGDTGCGKSTQVPQYLLEAGFSKIACTQPRRIACISLCKRVSYEMSNKYADLIGYQIRFEKQCKQDTKILFVTDGILLRQVANDGALSHYDLVILDEVHERHIQGDFLLGILKCLLHQREDFKLILMSATININLFSDYFGGNAKLIKVPGRLYPIKLHYCPPLINDFDAVKKETICPAPYIRILNMIDNKYTIAERGDVLIFLSGINEITTVVEAALKFNEKSKKWIILPLHSTLSMADQDKVFDYAPEGFRKCIVSTNIAETSVTIDGVRFVIDSGMMKEMSYDPVCKMQRLKEFWISKASAEQRKGRAGRTGPGVCFRLYSESDLAALAEFTTPEIQRVPLDSVILQMISMGLPDVRKFPFLEAPPCDLIENALISLKQHTALLENEKLSPMGLLLSKLPIDLCLGKVLINGSLFDQIEPALSLAAALSVQSPYTHYAFRDLTCETARRSCESDHGDPITLLNALKEWLEVKGSSQGLRSSSKHWAKARGFEDARFYEMIKLRSQFKILLEESGLLKQSISESLSSGEKVFRKGEQKLLRELKRKYAYSEINRRSKVLKPDTWEIEDSRDEDTDLKDINFRLSTDSSTLNSLVSGSTACSFKDLTMLKVILLSGLYPQVAVPDEFNHCKGVNEQLFHTRNKPFVFLHPQSFFGNHPEIIHLEENHIVHAPGFSNRNPLSAKHQILCYISLLETNKPYLVNTLRMPLAQSLLLVANELFTNSDFTSIICDSWVRLSFQSGEIVEKLLLQIVKLRNKWQELLRAKIEGGNCSTCELSSGIIKVMSSEVVCSYKRLLPADLKTCFNHSMFECSEEQMNPFQVDFKITPNKKYGGLQLSSFLTYNCLTDTGNSPLFFCGICHLSSPLSSLERLQHQMICSPQLFQEETSREPNPEQRKIQNAKKYNCILCNKHLYLTASEILKHQKNHKESPS